MGNQFLLVAGAFASVTLLSYGIIACWVNRKLVNDRIHKFQGNAALTSKPRNDTFILQTRFMQWISSFGQRGLRSSEDTSKIRSALIRAGFRHPMGPAIYFGFRVLTALLLPLPYFLAVLVQGKVEPNTLVFCFLQAGGGFFLPNYLLRMIVYRRQDRLDKALPDFLDLLIVSMESGLSLQATLNRVSEETIEISRDLYTELQLTTAEMRAGITREAALNNFGERTGVQSIKSLVSMLVQSDKLGASIVESLRTHSGFLRVQRAQKAEEIAGKMPVKILFPMIFFIFPALFIVIMGPAAIQIISEPFFKF